jgi:hypothetical protein
MTNPDLTHYDAILRRLLNERARLEAATDPREIEMRKVWVAGVEAELAAEAKFIGFEEMTLEEVFAELEDV